MPLLAAAGLRTGGELESPLEVLEDLDGEADS